ncbi:hypothetical protein QVD17_05992 [Tagetes erecta]|uniref:Uncharacterized protein n=1 Tax=Tagetes erecta TaxID=13708 RepID=A0AAD8LEU7_TARER|nr:hypothetical protein QVD17_05992 [Tagetes erecta]
MYSYRRSKQVTHQREDMQMLLDLCYVWIIFYVETGDSTASFPDGVPDSRLILQKQFFDDCGCGDCTFELMV